MTQTDQKKTTMGIYVHIPFCQKKCYYCDFYSLPGRNKSLIDEYCLAVTDDIKLSSYTTNYATKNIFFVA